MSNHPFFYILYHMTVDLKLINAPQGQDIINNCFKFGNHKMSSDLIMICDTERFCIKFDKFYHLRKIKT